MGEKPSQIILDYGTRQRRRPPTPAVCYLVIGLLFVFFGIGLCVHASEIIWESEVEPAFSWGLGQYIFKMLVSFIIFGVGALAIGLLLILSSLRRNAKIRLMTTTKGIAVDAIKLNPPTD